MSTAFVSADIDRASAVPTPSAAPAHAAPANRHLPPLVRTATGWAPQAPKTIADTGLDAWIVNDLALKLAATVPHLSTDWAAEQLRLPTPLV